ncbi:NAD(+)/NADH kinase [Actinomadura verrucosospora]|uniref:NAD kinase n=1 Tax=Actinomadura verrucosospora TaxID=46165 RepID=A0A7D4AIV1_ACTVE|nr:NAD(+)/NADH kinase [Actinomadura verrucosospora]QKG19788.1 ATP-nad/acox kinase [Actinomadura verrucosospora]
MGAEPQVGTVGLVLHPTRPVGPSVEAIVGAARGRPARVLVRPADRHRVPSGVEVVPDDRFAGEVDGLIALGGDGTILGAMRLVIDRPVPVLGVNHGNLGFLAEVHPPQLPAALARLAARDFTIEQHAALRVDAGRVPLTTRFGFNDMVLGRSSRTGAVSLDLTVNDLQYGYYRADALVVSTPTGSTAYNYAAGGPIVSPSSNAMVITPVAPMSGISRPVVLGAADRIRLAVAADSAPITLDIDGTAAAELGHGDGLTATMLPEAGQVVRLSAREHASRSRVKLSLLDLPLRPDQLLELIPSELRRDAEAAAGRLQGALPPGLD